MQLTHCKLSLRNMDFRLSTNIQQLLCKKQNKTKLIEKRVKKKKSNNKTIKQGDTFNRISYSVGFKIN